MVQSGHAIFTSHPKINQAENFGFLVFPQLHTKRIQGGPTPQLKSPAGGSRIMQRAHREEPTESWQVISRSQANPIPPLATPQSSPRPLCTLGIGITSPDSLCFRVARTTPLKKAEAVEGKPRLRRLPKRPLATCRGKNRRQSVPPGAALSLRPTL